MDQIVIIEKLESLRRCIQRIEDKKPADIGQLKQDIDLQDILVLNLSRAVQLSVDIGSHIISQSGHASPQTMGNVFITLQDMNVISEQVCYQLTKAVGFRNIAVHQYEAINWEIVYAVCEQSVHDFRQFAREISRYAGL